MPDPRLEGLRFPVGPMPAPPPPPRLLDIAELVANRPLGDAQEIARRVLHGPADHEAAIDQLAERIQDHAPAGDDDWGPCRRLAARILGEHPPC